jgi:hypothetical protein
MDISKKTPSSKQEKTPSSKQEKTPSSKQEKTPSSKQEKTPSSKPIFKSPLDAVIAKYTEYNWTVIKSPKNGLTDLVVSKGERFHHVQIVTPETIDEQRYHGEAKTNFIQNAFSNQATPVFAHVVSSNLKGTTDKKYKVTFEDVNTNNRVIIGGKKLSKRTVQNPKK